MKHVKIEDALNMLQDALELDIDAIERVIQLRVLCGPMFAGHEGNVVFRNTDFSELALLGPLELINSLFEKEDGCIEPEFDVRGRLTGFEIVKPCPEMHTSDQLGA